MLSLSINIIYIRKSIEKGVIIFLHNFNIILNFKKTIKQNNPIWIRNVNFIYIYIYIYIIYTYIYYLFIFYML